MKALIKLAKELDFNNEMEYFDYCIDSHINGDFTQCKDLFKAMKKEDRKLFISYLNGASEYNGYIQTRIFYFALL